MPPPASGSVRVTISQASACVNIAFLAELVRCGNDDDCTTWMPVFRCDDRVQITDCPAPLASGMLDAAQLWFGQLEQELCPGIAQRCFSSPSCAGGSLQCRSGRCALVRDAGL